MTTNDLELHEVDEIRGLSLATGFAFVSLRPKEGGEHQWLARRAACVQQLAERNIPVEMLQFSPARMRFVVDAEAADSVREVAESGGVAWRVVPRCSKVRLVGSGIARTAGIYHRALSGLSERNIPVLSFSDSSVTITILVPESHGVQAERALYELLLRDPESRLEGAISFDAALARVRINGRERRLGTRQVELLGFLLENAGRVVTAEEAARHLFGSDGKDEVAALRVHLHNLRKKIEADPDRPRHIVTVPSQGYRFVR